MNLKNAITSNKMDIIIPIAPIMLLKYNTIQLTINNMIEIITNTNI